MFRVCFSVTQAVISLQEKVNNLFDEAYETFGFFGEAAEALGEAFEGLRFLSPGAPRAA